MDLNVVIVIVVSLIALVVQWRTGKEWLAAIVAGTGLIVAGIADSTVPSQTRNLMFVIGAFVIIGGLIQQNHNAKRARLDK